MLTLAERALLQELGDLVCHLRVYAMAHAGTQRRP
jgi:hypothetical protein